MLKIDSLSPSPSLNCIETDQCKNEIYRGGHCGEPDGLRRVRHQTRHVNDRCRVVHDGVYPRELLEELQHRTNYERMATIWVLISFFVNY